MKKRPYKRKPGEFEIRILKDGQVIMVAPDEALVEVASAVEPNNIALPSKWRQQKNGRTKASKTK